MQDDKYFSRSWALLTRDRGWAKPLLVMAAATLVPVAGPLGNKGYALEWARLVAWGADAAPKQKNVDVGTCIGSGWRAFVVDLGWGACYAVAYSLLALVAAVFPGVLGSLLAGVVSLANLVLGAAFGCVLLVAELRAAIYESIGAGYKVSRISDMIRRDTGGFGKVFLVSLACAAVVSLAGVVLSIIVAVAFMPVIMVAAGSGASEYAVVSAVASSLMWIVPAMVLLGYVLSFLGNGVRMIMAGVVGLWMSQFDVASWGRSEDPLPADGGPAPVTQHPASQDDYVPQAVSQNDYVPQMTPQELPYQEQEAPQQDAPAPDDEAPLVEQVRDVDDLYAQLYDVIGRDDRTGSDEE